MSVQLFDTLGHPLGANVLHFVKLQPHLGSSIVRVKASEGLDHTLEGVAFGETTVAFSTAAVRSSVVNVQVFAPLKLSPRNVTLVLGATMQVVSGIFILLMTNCTKFISLGEFRWASTRCRCRV
jgi:nuclear pore complex protein Nup210